MDAGLAVPVYHVVDGPRIAPVENAGIDQVLPEEGLVGDFRDPVAAVAPDDDDLAQVGAFADEFAAVIPFQAGADEALREVGVEFGVVGDDLGGRNRLQGSDFRLARECGAVFLLQRAEPVDGVLGQLGEVLPHLGHLVLQGVDLFVQGLGVELGDFPDRLFHQLQDIVHRDFPVEEVLVLLHLGEDVVKLLFPAHLVLFQDLIDPVFEEDALQGVVVPLLFQFAELDFQPPAQQLFRMEGVVLEDFTH